jgi:hypothetical protein
MPVARAKAEIRRPTWDDVNADPAILFDPDDALAVDTTRSWVDPNGYRLSDRIWKAGSYDRAMLDTELHAGLALGLGPEQVAKNIEGYMTPAGQAMRTRSPRAGMGNYAARRLARTETTRAFGDALKKSAAINPFLKGMKWLLSGSHEDIDICDEHAQRSSSGEEWGPGEYAFDDTPPYPSHPNDLCTLATIDVDQNAIDAMVGRLNNPAPVFPLESGPSMQEMAEAFIHAGEERSEFAFDPKTMSAMGPDYPPPFTPTDDYVAAEDYAESLGVKEAHFDPISPNLWKPALAAGTPVSAGEEVIRKEGINSMNAINEALHAVAARGLLPMPQKVNNIFDGNLPDSIAYQSSEDDSINANLFSPTWVDPAPDIANMHEEGWTAGETPSDMIIHELGHHFHIGLGLDPNVMALQRHFPTAEEDATMASVSQYAQTSPYEFVAEVFTKLFKGDKVTPEQMALYKQWYGPDVPPEKKP